VPLVLGGLLLVAAGCKEEAEEEETVDELSCEKDDSEGADTAVDLEPGEETEGYLCPRQDEDWYALSLAAGDRLLEVSLQMTNPRAPVEPTYAVWSTDGRGRPKTVVAEPPAESVGVGAVISEVHCLDPGDYFISVRDQGNDAQDLRNRYRLRAEPLPEPDDNEPNQDADSATPLRAGGEIQGFIACGGDQDHYLVTVAQQEVVQVNLSSEIAGYQPRLRLLTAFGNVLADQENAAGTAEATDIDLYQVVPSAGDYLLVVSDDDDVETDPDVPYTIRFAAISDRDPNEPNNHPGEAVALSESTEPCAELWSAVYEVRGTIGSPGDTDWYRLPVSGCEGGLVEADLAYDNGARSDADAWTLQSEVQASLTLLRSHAATPCADDADCQSLNIECAAGQEHAEWECQGYFNACGSDGFCVGAAVCLPDGTCGANQVERHYRSAAVPDPITGPPPPHEVALGAPLFGGDDLYLRVSDFQSDGGDPDAEYTLQVRVRSDTDAHDRAPTPNNVYGNSLTSENLQAAVEQSLDRAVGVVVHDCTSGDCCDTAEWTEGAVSYQNDFDLYTYDHPCPEADCLLKLHYRVDDGPVDHGLFLYQGASEWYSFEIAGTGVFGDDECLYAYFKHENPYYILVRDYLGEDAPPEEQVGWAGRWSPDQLYSFCIEKYSDKCEAPCEQTENDGCTSP
jgi:hypothetical protein